jgi:hypothetical protein
MLFALAFAPAAPLRRAFPGVPFVALAGRTPLLVWFSRVRQGCAVSADGEWRCEGGDSEMLYHEVTVIGLLRRRALFVPGIYATSVRSTLLARHYYRMPKETVAMSLSTRGARFEAHGLDGACRSRLRAQLLGSGHWPAWFLRPLWPLRVWPVLFPAGTHVEAVVDAAPRVYLAAVSEGRLRVNAPWLRRPVRLLPLGLYVPALRLRLLPPPHWCDPL